MRHERNVHIGTRGSHLALWQAEHVASALRAGGIGVSIEIIQTKGDLDHKSDFGSMGAKGIFVKEIEEALLEGRIDLAVHSLKDLPTELPEGLALGAVLPRESPNDALVSRNGLRFDELPEGATIASGSLRRLAQALSARPDLKPLPLRGNVPTRVHKIREGYADATFLALAGLRRLGLEHEASEVLPATLMTPPMGQGALALEVREGELLDVMDALDHEPTRCAVAAERAFIGRIGGGCRTPAGVLVEPMEPSEAHGRPAWRITGMIASEDGRSLIRRELVVAAALGAEGDPLSDLRPDAIALAESMMADADDAIRATLRG